MQNSQCSGSGCSSSFQARQEAACVKRGRANATAGSRHAAEMPTEEAASHADDDLASVASGLSLGGRSLHPSVAGTTISMACSEVTIGAGDDTGYWDYKHREVTRSDLGHNCRECRKPFRTIGEPMTERRGARVTMRYHAEC